MPLVFIFEGVGTEAADIILLFYGDARVDGFEDFDAGEDEKDTNFRLVGVVGGVTAKGRAGAAVGDDCGNGTELRGSAAVEADGFDYFLYWILVGCPYGIRKMCMFLVPKNFGIAGSMGILALNCIVGGLIGGIIVLVRIIVIFTEIIKVIAGHFWTQCPKV